MKYLDVFILKNFSIERAKKFAEAIFNVSNEYAFLRHYKSIVVKINKNYIKICSQLSEEDMSTLDNAHSREEIDFTKLDITSAYYFIALCGLYILNCEDAEKQFLLENNEQIIWEDNESKVRKTTDMGDFKNKVQLMSLMEGMDKQDLFDEFVGDDFLFAFASSPSTIIRSAIAKALQEPKAEISKEAFIKVVGEKIHML